MERKWRTVNSRKLWLNTHKQVKKSVLQYSMITKQLRHTMKCIPRNDNTDVVEHRKQTQGNNRNESDLKIHKPEIQMKSWRFLVSRNPKKNDEIRNLCPLRGTKGDKFTESRWNPGLRWLNKMSYVYGRESPEAPRVFADHLGEAGDVGFGAASSRPPGSHKCWLDSGLHRVPPVVGPWHPGRAKRDSVTSW